MEGHSLAAAAGADLDLARVAELVDELGLGARGGGPELLDDGVGVAQSEHAERHEEHRRRNDAGDQRDRAVGLEVEKSDGVRGVDLRGVDQEHQHQGAARGGRGEMMETAL